jgi:DNA polymerase I-like protein with 3'-5' exonuclease and polymerase domains
MIDWLVASQVASVAANAVASLDKMYRGYADFFEKRDATVGAPEPSFKIQDKPAEKAIVASWVHSGETAQKITYQELATKLSPSDLAHIETFSRSLENYQKQWDSAYEAKSLASGMDVGRLDAQLDYIARQMSEPLLKVLDFVEHMGLLLDDHYLAARQIAQKYTKHNN